MHVKRSVLIFLCLLFWGCSSVPEQGEKVGSEPSSNLAAANAKSFFAIYAKRDNIAALMEYYAEDALLEDMVFGDRLEGKLAIRKFLDWENPHFVSEQAEVLVIQQQIVKHNQVITRGYFTPFVYHGQTLGPWRFVIWHSFDEEGKIIHQQDWINYTPKEQFVGGKNLNLAMPDKL